MKTGIFIAARLGSTRLKNKHLLPVNGQPIIYFLVRRIMNQFKQEIDKDMINVIITTSDEKENKQFNQFVDMGIYVFYGSKNNIPLRQVQAADFYGLGAIISIDGDDILCSPESMREVYKRLKNNAKYIITSNLPLGMNSFGYSTDFLKRSLDQRTNEVLETGWTRIFDERQRTDVNIPIDTKNRIIRLTLDYQEDYIFFKTLIESMGEKIYDAKDQTIIDFIINNKFYNLNESVNEEYWENFEKSMNREIDTKN